MAFVLALIAANISFGTAITLCPRLKAFPSFAYLANLFRLRAAFRRTARAHSPCQSRATKRRRNRICSGIPGCTTKKLLFSRYAKGQSHAVASAIFALVRPERCLLTDASPATLRDNASQSWTGADCTDTTGGAYVTPRGHDKVISAVFQGSADNIDELFFFTVAENSSLVPSMAQRLLPRRQLPVKLTSPVEKIASELFDRTRVETGLNTKMALENNTTMFYEKLLPRDGAEGNIAMVIRIKTGGKTIYIQCF